MLGECALKRDSRRAARIENRQLMCIYFDYYEALDLRPGLKTAAGPSPDPGTSAV